MKRTYYWHDALNDDFADNNIKRRSLPKNYKYYSKNIFYLFFENIIRLLSYPIIAIILKCCFHVKFVNKKALKAAKGKGFFLYGNHTNALLDAYVPTVLTFPRKSHIIANADAVSIKGLGTIVKMMGAVPIPSDLRELLKFKNSINKMALDKRVIAIYPEAHIWPYYTDIRPFGKQSFHYAVETNLPSFVITNIYVKRKHSDKPRVISYIDGPFYPDQTLAATDQVQNLRDVVYNTMKKRVDENPKYNYCEYIYVEDGDIKELNKMKK